MGNDTGKSKVTPTYGWEKKVNWGINTAKLVKGDAVAAFILKVVKHTNIWSGETFFSLSEAGREFGYPRETMSRAASKVIRSGMLETDKRPGRTTIYKMVLPETCFSEDVAEKPVTQTSQAEPVTLTSRVHANPLPGDHGTRNPNITGPVAPKSHEILSERSMEILLERKDASEQPHTLAGAPLAAIEQKRDRSRFEWFWTTYPNRTNVKAAENLLLTLEADGIDRNEIEPGLQRFRRYCDATGNIRMSRMSPVKWLESGKWLDDWQTTKDRSAKSGKGNGIGIPSASDMDAMRKRYKAALNLGMDDRHEDEIEALSALRKEMWQRFISPHIWGGDNVPDGREKELSICPTCWSALYGLNDDAEPCKDMRDIMILYIDVDDEISIVEEHLEKDNS